MARVASTQRRFYDASLAAGVSVVDDGLIEEHAFWGTTSLEAVSPNEPWFELDNGTVKRGMEGDREGRQTGARSSIDTLGIRGYARRNRSSKKAVKRGV